MSDKQERFDVLKAWGLLKELWAVGSLPLVFCAIGLAAMMVPDRILTSGEQDVVSRLLFCLAALVFVGNLGLEFYRWKKTFETFAQQNELIVAKLLDEAIRLSGEGVDGEKMTKKLRDLVDTLNSIGLRFQRYALK